MENKELTKVFFINWTTGESGSEEVLFQRRYRADTGKDRVEITFPMIKKHVGKVDYYFNEQEFIEDKKLI